MPGVEQEVAGVGPAQSDPLHRSRGQRAQELAGGLDRVVGHANGAGEDVGRPSGQHAERGLRAGQAVGGLIEGAVASQDYGCVQPVGGRPLGQPGACPLRLVSFSITSWSAESALCITTRARAVTNEADVFTIKSNRIGTREQAGKEICE